MSDSNAYPIGTGAVSRPAAAVGASGAASSFNWLGPIPGGPISSRVAVLFLGLAMVKLILLASQGESLYEAHWRIGGSPESWLNVAAFYAFVLLGGLSLVELGKYSQSMTSKGARLLNGSVLALGLGFIFLTFHNGDKNFLYPVVKGVLKWTSLIPYTANATLFNKPFLGAWLFGYALSYYVLVRTNRERWALWLTAVTACAYAVVNLRQFTVRRDELLIIDGLGVLSLAAWRLKVQSGERLFVSWLFAPAGWALFFAWALLRFDNQWQTIAASYFLGVIALTLMAFALAGLLMRRQGNSVPWGWFLPFFVAAWLLLTNTYYPASENYNHLLCLALTFPRYFAGELGVALVLGAGAWVYRRVRPGGNLAWVDVLGLTAIVVALVDLRLSQVMGVRLGWDLLAFGDSPRMMLKLAKPYLPGLITGIVVIAALYVLALRAFQAWAHSNQPIALTRTPLPRERGNKDAVLTEQSSSRAGAAYLAMLFVVLGAVGLGTAEPDKAEGQAIARLVRTSPLWKRVASRSMSREEFLKSAASLGLGDFNVPSAVAHNKPRRDLNVIIVFMESSYNKHLSLFGSSEETQPLLSKYKDRMELFPNFFSAFAGSIHARFATFTSLYPVSDFHVFTQDRVPVKSVFEVLHDEGYTCSMFYSSYFDYTGFRDFLKNRGLDEMYDADTMPGQRGSERVEWGLLEEETLGAIRAQLQKYAQDHRRFCLTYVPAAPHYPYDKIPKRFRKFTMKEMGDFTPVYLNELLYIDWVLASIVDQLKESGLLENTLVMITNDHGEMLGGKEDEHIGHGWAMTPQLANTPLIVMDPARPGFQINKTIGTQVDFLPTLLDRLNIPIPPEQLYEGQSLDAEHRQARRGYVNSYKQFAIVDGDKLLLGDRESNNPAGPASRGAGFSITNDGARTIFTELEGMGAALAERVAGMGRFDAFQESLLRNYSVYSSSIAAGGRQLAKRSGGNNAVENHE